MCNKIVVSAVAIVKTCREARKRGVRWPKLPPCYAPLLLCPPYVWRRVTVSLVACVPCGLSRAVGGKEGVKGAT